MESNAVKARDATEELRVILVKNKWACIFCVLMGKIQTDFTGIDWFVSQQIYGST
jgi:uncharacterized membrane protein AbrB (regulator of aidB expression)